MVPDVDGYVVGGGVPPWLPGHVVVERPSVDFEVLEAYVADFSLRVVAVDDGEVGLWPVVAYVFEGDVLDGSSRRLAVLLVVADLDVEDAALADLLDAYVVEGDVADEVVVSGIDGEASLVVHLWLSLT